MRRGHPCRCRGNLALRLVDTGAEGSSLPVQGQRRIEALRRATLGFIPAGAGATR
ncbi:hypothetical protein ACM9LZ_17555 [Niveispirillum fermenti]